MPERLDSTDRIAALEAEVAQLRQAVAAHAVIDQALGVVVACTGVRPATAWEILREVSQGTNTKMREIAQLVVDWPHRRTLPPEIREALNTAARRRTTQSSPQVARR
ncbi:ANTAR domain-containing protein [Streptomyces sp. Act143]|uniref:ANTAR domain-containing protein n=1 Tax=Streptomyces sp. Act143 TaxID=2200760 RepID=UPI000D67A5D0|nr:ANTAR domain-containing protein [Streptomyces sp. Act143]PWI12787.1 ANTAR domain-containing protein [Streptomyces sp. Act143]